MISGSLKRPRKTNFKVLSVDVNRCVGVPGYVIDNILKGVDTAIMNSINEIMAGAKSSVSSVGLKEGGMSLLALQEDRLAESHSV